MRRSGKTDAAELIAEGSRMDKEALRAGASAAGNAGRIDVGLEAAARARRKSGRWELTGVEDSEAAARAAVDLAAADWEGSVADWRDDGMVRAVAEVTARGRAIRIPGSFGRNGMKTGLEGREREGRGSVAGWAAES